MESHELEVYRKGYDVEMSEEEKEELYAIQDKVETAIRYLESMNYDVIWKEPKRSK